MPRTGASSARRVWGPGLEAESDARCKTSVGSSAHRCPGSPFPKPLWVCSASAQRCQPPPGPYTGAPANQAPPELKNSLGGSLAPGIAPPSLISPQAPCDPSHWRWGGFHRAEFGGAPGSRGAKPAGPAAVGAVRAQLGPTGTRRCSRGAHGANQHHTLG